MVEFFFDCSSPWTWLGFRNMQRTSEAKGIPVRWRPFLLGAVFNTVNPSVYEFRERGVPAKKAYLKKDLADWARADDIVLLYPPTVFPVNTVKVMRGCILLDSFGLLVPFAAAAFKAYWTDDQDIGDDRVLRSLCERIGFDPTVFFDGIESPGVKQQLRANTDELMARGGFGSPTIFVGDDMYFGNDRMPLVIRALEGHQESQAATKGAKE
jgi:2-hydroxychromene-2-carboxylate isomerase